jgi:uncharacterized protein (DUF2147 family)
VKQQHKHERNLIMNKLFLILIFSLLGSVLFAQTDLTGTWDTGKENTLVKIYEKEGVYLGEIISSDNPKAEIGTQLIKDLNNEDGEWRGQLYAIKREKWVDAEMELEEGILKIKVSAGFRSRTVEWTKVKSEAEADTIKTEDIDEF